MQQRLERKKLRLVPMLRLLVQELVLVQVLQLEPVLAQELLPSCRKQPGRQQRRRPPEREIYSFLLSLMIEENNFRKWSLKT